VKHLNVKIKHNKELMMFAISHNFHIYDALPIGLKNDKDIIKCAKEAGWKNKKNKYNQ